jgi:hypothetical protein
MSFDENSEEWGFELSDDIEESKDVWKESVKQFVHDVLNVFYEIRKNKVTTQVYKNFVNDVKALKGDQIERSLSFVEIMKKRFDICFSIETDTTEKLECVKLLIDFILETDEKVDLLFSPISRFELFETKRKFKRIQEFIETGLESIRGLTLMGMSSSNPRLKRSLSDSLVEVKRKQEEFKEMNEIKYVNEILASEFTSEMIEIYSQAMKQAVKAGKMDTFSRFAKNPSPRFANYKGLVFFFVGEYIMDLVENSENVEDILPYFLVLMKNFHFSSYFQDLLKKRVRFFEIVWETQNKEFISGLLKYVSHLENKLKDLFFERVRFINAETETLLVPLFAETDSYHKRVVRIGDFEV